jgi:hypothetical protein
LAAAALAAAALIWMQLASLDDEIQEMTARFEQRKSQAGDAETMRRDVDEIGTFLRSDVTWLDEMYSLAERLPPSDEMVVEAMTAGIRPAGGGQITLEGLVREPDVVEAIDEALRAGGRKVISESVRDTQRQEKYKWHYKETVMIEPGSETTAAGADRERPPAGEPPAPATAAAGTGAAKK